MTINWPGAAAWRKQAGARSKPRNSNMKNNKYTSAHCNPALVLLALANIYATTASAAMLGTTNAMSNLATNQQSATFLIKSLRLTYGNFDFHPRLSTAIVYNDNINLSGQHPQRDEISQVSPGLQIMGGDTHSLRTYIQESRLYNQFFDVGQINPLWLMAQPVEKWPDKFLFLDYTAVWNNYMHYSANDSLDHRLNALAVWPMAKLVLAFRQEFVDAKEDIFVANTRTEVQHIETALDAGYVINDDLNLGSTWGRQSYAYPNASSLTGYTEWKGLVSVNRNCFDTIRLGLEVAGGEDEITSGRNQQFVQTGILVRYKCSELFSIDGSAGLEYRQFDSGVPNAYNPYAALNVRYQPWDRLYVSADLVRQTIPDLLNNLGYYENSISLALNKEITDRFTLSTKVGYEHDESYSTDSSASSLPVNDYVNLGLVAEYKLEQRVTLQAAYSYYTLTDNTSWERNTIMLKMLLHF